MEDHRVHHSGFARDLIMGAVHLTLFSVSLLLAFVLAHNFSPASEWFGKQYLLTLPIVLVLKYPLFASRHLLQISWRYFGYRDFFGIAFACTLTTGLLVCGLWSAREFPNIPIVRALVWVPLTVAILDGMLSVGLLTSARFAARYLFEQGRNSGMSGRRKLIIGAGDAGETLLREIQRMPVDKHHVVGFLDDDTKKIGTRIHGITVLGPIESVKYHCATNNIDEVMIAIPSAPQSRIREIVELCEGACIGFTIVPGLTELIEGTRTIESQLREIRLDDLLQRDTAQLDHAAIGHCLRDKVVLVTGGGGSIGSELCRQILHYKPRRLVIVELSENNLFEIERELAEHSGDAEIRGYLGDICDHVRMSTIYSAECPKIVCHAAAHKHVPMLEAHIVEGIQNNIVGTRLLADLAIVHGVEKFVYISTDKAVNPTSVMGCTKRIAEIYIQGLSERSKTEFMTVRFGNVLGSRGSVVPIFQQQIRQGGPITVTHPDITRYFMTISEAAQLVLQAGAIGQGGEIFLLEMGEPIKIVELAQHLITLNGLVPGRDIELVFTGLRPGEKLHEELYIRGEDLSETAHPHIRVWQKKAEDWRKIEAAIPVLSEQATSASPEEIREALVLLVPEYTPSQPSSAEDSAVQPLLAPPVN